MAKILVCCLILLHSTGCTGHWVWQEDYPKHRTMSFKCPRWNYDEAFDKLHHSWVTRQYEPLKLKGDVHLQYQQEEQGERQD